MGRNRWRGGLWLGFAYSAGIAIATDDPSGEWIQWRGAARDGHVADDQAPAQWPTSLVRSWAHNIGNGHSSPVVSGSRVFTITRRGDDEVVTALDLETGEVAWEHTYPAAIGINPYADGHGRWPRSTPAIDQQRLVTLGAAATLSVWDTQSGDLLWQATRDEGIDTSELFCGTSTSPIIDAGRVIVHLGDDSGGELVAFRLEDGEVLWRNRIEGPGYASPVRARLGGDDQLVTLTMSRVIGFGLEDGRLLWSAPFKDAWNENIVTPIVMGEDLLVAGVRQGTKSLRPERNDNGWTTEITWENRDATFYMSSPVLHDGVVYGFTKRRRGQLVALDATSGKTLWSHDERANNASVLLAGEHLVVLTTEGEWIVGRATADEWKEEQRYTVSENPTWAHPVLLRDRLIIKDSTEVVCFTFAEDED